MIEAVKIPEKIKKLRGISAKLKEIGAPVENLNEWISEQEYEMEFASGETNLSFEHWKVAKVIHRSSSHAIKTIIDDIADMLKNE